MSVEEKRNVKLNDTACVFHKSEGKINQKKNFPASYGAQCVSAATSDSCHGKEFFAVEELSEKVIRMKRANMSVKQQLKF